MAVRHAASSAALVRRAITADLESRHLDAELTDEVVLVASELVGNAVLHAGAAEHGHLAVRWEVEPDGVLVEVGDPSREVPQLRATDDNTAGGRGLVIVAAIADDWGVRYTDEGKRVWAHVPTARPA